MTLGQGTQPTQDDLKKKTPGRKHPSNFSPLMINKHHSVNHVYISHSDLLPFAKSTFYKYMQEPLGDEKRTFNLKKRENVSKVTSCNS